MVRADFPKPIVLNVAVTGHRAPVLSAALVRALRPLVYLVFRQLRRETLNLQRSEPQFCGSTEAQLFLHTPLASGADQIAAICARSSGYFVRALLPFEPSEYRNDFADGDELDMFEQALAAADEIVALPGQRSDLEGAYLLVGESLVRTADVLIAIWDGEPGRGPGGTANVVELALKNSRPVVHLHIDHATSAVQMRALIGEHMTIALSPSSDDTAVYGQVLRFALGLEHDRKDREAASPLSLVLP